MHKKILTIVIYLHYAYLLNAAQTPTTTRYRLHSVVTPNPLQTPESENRVSTLGVVTPEESTAQNNTAPTIRRVRNAPRMNKLDGFRSPRALHF